MVKNGPLQYRQGDKLIQEYGNTAYKGLKMIEPICSQEMSELARSHRPLIPAFTNFKDHIKSFLYLS